MKFLYWLFIAITTAIFVDFAVWNLEGVTVTLWPFGEFTSRLYLVVLLALLAGFLLGLLLAWVWSWGARRAAWERRRRIEALERDLAAAQERAKPGTGIVIPHS